MSELKRHLGLPGAVALAITIVVGSGALVLPGVAYRQSGQSALWAWLISAVLVIPLLVIFARLGATYPTAGGVAGFVQSAFGRQAAGGVELLLIGTFGFGIPAIALTGGYYLAALLGLAAGRAWLIALVILLIAASVNVLGVQLSARVQTVLAITLTIGLLAAATVGMAGGHGHPALPALTTASLGAGLASVGAVFFAFTGWEMLSFTVEEYRDPRRDFPRTVAISFLVVTGVYLLLAIGVQTQLSTTDSSLAATPVRAMVANVLGGAAGTAVSLLAVLIILANVIGAMWGASRLVMSSAREGLLPGFLRVVSPGSGVPRPAVAAVLLLFAVITTLCGTGVISLAGLLAIAGKNFYLIYVLSVIAYVRLFRAARERIFGIIVLLVLLAVATTFGLGQILYAVVLFTIGTLLAHWRHRRR